jgi:hypothetical protein
MGDEGRNTPLSHLLVINKAETGVKENLTVAELFGG